MSKKKSDADKKVEVIREVLAAAARLVDNLLECQDAWLSDVRNLDTARSKLATAYGLWSDGTPQTTCTVKGCAKTASYRGETCWEHRDKEPSA